MADQIDAALELHFLELASLGGMPLSYLVGSPDWYQQQWNRRWHGLSSSEVAKLLRRLKVRGDIDFRIGEGTFGDLADEALLGEIESRKRPFESMFYYVTPQGGARWEIAWQVDWSRYWEFQELDDEQLQFVMPNRDQLERLADYVARRHFWSIDLTRAQWEELRPWSVSYWKDLPQGVKLTVPYQRKPTAFSSAAEVETYLSAINSAKLEQDYWYGWCKKPAVPCQNPS